MKLPDLTAITLTPALALIVGIVLCFFGYKVQKAVITLAWFYLGYTFAIGLVPQFVDGKEICILISILVGLVMALIGFKLEKLALFIAVAYMVFISVGPYIHMGEDMLNLLVQAGVSLLAGALAVYMIRPVLIVATSLSGVTFVKDALPTFVTLSSNVLSIGAIVLVVVAILFQLKTTN